MTIDVFEHLESEVRSYCRQFPAIFRRAQGSWLEDVEGRRYLDLLAGAGTLNYGHNNPAIVEPVIAYLRSAGIVHSLDLFTEAKARFLVTFNQIILQPRGLTYKVQFPGPTGTNAVEAALKLARKVTGRTGVVAFSNGYHGMTLGALAATANSAKRTAAYMPLPPVTFLPFDGFLGPSIDTAELAKQMLEQTGSGIDKPAAILVETVQGEGGLNACRPEWLRAIATIARRIGALLIVDDIQAGCGRTGSFFSFESAGIEPDIILLSKSISGFGTPLAVILLRPGIDIWSPGEHNGTFRGNNLGFVGATAALECYWSDSSFSTEIETKATMMRDRLTAIVRRLPPGTATLRGRGLMTGLAFSDISVASKLSTDLFGEGFIVETCGANDDVLKLLPPLTIETDALVLALKALERVAVNTFSGIDRIAV